MLVQVGWEPGGRVLSHVCPPESLRMGVRWSVATPLSSQHGAARLEERRVPSAHDTIQPSDVPDRS